MKFSVPPNRLGLSPPSRLTIAFRIEKPRKVLSTRIPHASGPGQNQNGATSQKPVITDDTVPEGHAGLHSYLYGGGEDSGEEHASHRDGADYSITRGEDDGTFLINLDSYIATRQSGQLTGVFGVYDVSKNLQYVSFGRNIVRKLKALRANLPEDRVAYVRVMIFANRAMQTRAALEREAANWLDAAGTLPPGNGAEASLWEEASKDDKRVVSDQERSSYLDKKDKLQKAMGINENGTPTNENIDWSAAAADAAAGSNQPKVQTTTTTPFANANVHRSVANADDDVPELAMNVETVNETLEEVRPYLIADGGNVEVVSVDPVTGVVALELQGACGSCPASSSTMKMGIERSLRAAFPTQLKEVVAVSNDGSTSTAGNGITPEAVDLHLNLLRGAVAAYGGSVNVVSVENDDTLLVLKYSGPKPIGYGIIAAVKEKFPSLQQVIMLDAESGEAIQF